MQINKDNCLMCGACAGECSVSAINKNSDGTYTIDQDVCVNCENCKQVCPGDAING